MAKAKTKTKTKAKPKAKKAAAKPAKPAKTAARPKAPAAPPPTGLFAIRSVIYTVTDLPRAKAFYGAVLGREPYFDQPYYVGFDVAGQELGLDPDTSRRQPGPGGAVAYWKVHDLHTAWELTLMNGADPLEPPHNVGEGTDIALIADPFGNLVGLIQVAD